MKSLLELKKQLSDREAVFQQQQAADPSLQSKQFSIRFGDGSVLFMQPSKMDKVGNLPIYNPEKYLREHHPERLSEFLRIRAHNECAIREDLDKLEKHKSQYAYNFF
jgi:hypothetical protein